MPIGYAVEPERCLGCGSCAILAPGVFAVVRRVRLMRQPATEAEVTACAAAALVCPTMVSEHRITDYAPRGSGTVIVSWPRSTTPSRSGNTLIASSS